MALFQVRDLTVGFDTPRGEVHAVRGCSFDINEGECLAVVGESGCGKSVTARAVMGLTAATGGHVGEGSRILFRGSDVLCYSERELRAYRGGDVSMVFQDSMTSLNPTMRVGAQVAECLTAHGKCGRRGAAEKAEELLGKVGIANPGDSARRYPHEFSGGQRQRVVIAAALACEPALLIADEPTTALDVTIQAQILDLIGELRRERGTSVLLITHDMGVVAGTADRVAVMYAGRIVETGTVDEIFYRTAHPYTLGLRNASPRLDEVEEGAGGPDRRLRTIEGAPPELIDVPTGCAFAPRCPFVDESCLGAAPEWTSLGPTHGVACHHRLRGE